MTDIELLSYLLMFMLSVLWSSLAIQRSGPIFSFLSWISWHTFAILHLLSSYSSTFYVLVWMFFGLGTIFLILALVKTWQQIQDSSRKREMELI